MVIETPIEPETEGTPEPASQEASAASEAPEPEVSAEPEVSTASAPKKRGRPKKEPEPPPPPEPAPKKRGRPKKPAHAPQAPPPTPEASSAREPFALDTMSNAQLVAELVNRRRQTERQMKQDLFRSFVM